MSNNIGSQLFCIAKYSLIGIKLFRNEMQQINVLTVDTLCIIYLYNTYINF